MKIKGKQVWRVSEDGEIRDPFRRLHYVFEMSELSFFKHYIKNSIINDEYFQGCKNQLNELRDKIPELPFSNIWVASKMAQNIPPNSIIHFGILNSLRAWNFFELPQSVSSSSNVGGFGIDGIMSTLIGASFFDNNKLYFCVLGDLAFFYDMNALGNRHVNNNLRILLINNGVGAEFKMYSHLAYKHGDNANEYIAAAGHYGNKSSVLVKHCAEDLGFEYLSATNKQEFENVYNRFFVNENLKPILFEVFTNDFDENSALEKMLSIEKPLIYKTKQTIKKMLGDKNVDFMKNIIRK